MRHQDLAKASVIQSDRRIKALKQQEKNAGICHQWLLEAGKTQFIAIPTAGLFPGRRNNSPDPLREEGDTEYDKEILKKDKNEDRDRLKMCFRDG